MDLVDQFYEQTAHFQDPIHQLKGVSAIRDYYQKLYENAELVQFEFLNA